MVTQCHPSLSSSKESTTTCIAGGLDFKARMCFHRCVCHRVQSTWFETKNQPIERLPSVWRKRQAFLETLQGLMSAPEMFRPLSAAPASPTAAACSSTTSPALARALPVTKSHATAWEVVRSWGLIRLSASSQPATGPGPFSDRTCSVQSWHSKHLLST